MLKLSQGVVFPSTCARSVRGGAARRRDVRRPLISTEVGSGTSHVNVDGENRPRGRSGSPSAMRRARDQLHHRPDMARLMGRNARRRYERLFTGELMGLRYAEIYRGLSDGTASGSDPAGGVRRDQPPLKRRALGSLATAESCADRHGQPEQHHVQPILSTSS